MKKYAIVLLLILLGLQTCLSVDQSDPSNNKVPPGQLKKLADQELIAQANTIDIQNLLFQPSTLTVTTGTTVTWYNQDNVQHTVTSDNAGLFDSGAIKPGKAFSFTFNTPGSYNYHCNIHPSMHGVVVVSGAAVQEVYSPTLKNVVPPGQIKKLANQEPIQGLIPGAAQNALTGTQNLAQGLTSPSGGNKPSWSEKQVNVQTSMSSSTNLLQASQSAPIGTTLQQPTMPSSTQSQIQKFTQYYQINPQKPSEPLSAPTKFVLTGHEPTALYFGSIQKSVPYTQYQSYLQSAGLNSLWIQGTSSWTQYAMVPFGSSLSLISTSPSGGNGYLYEVYPDGTLDKNGYYFYPYNQMGFYADSVGQHLLFYAIDGQPSNVIVIDVIAYQPLPFVYNYASVTISSSWLMGYDVYVDGYYMATEGTTGEAPGVLTVTVPGNHYHTIAIYGNSFSFSDYKYFNSGWAYTLNV
jgi:plastocyanin